MSNGTFKINDGTVDISGDLRIQTENTDSNGNVSYSDSYGYLDMTNENDYVKVGKDFVTYSRYSHNGYLTEGTLEVKGDFTQISGNGSNYYASGNHRTILSGDKLQTVAGSSTNMHFAVLELQNFSEEGIHFNQAKQELRMKEWSEQIRAQQNNGLTVQKWCRENGISPKEY